ncbi:MAG: N-acetyltransferase [Thermodesulfobacteriota bacterium]
MIIRAESPADIDAITAVTIAALTLTLVAELDGQVVGHIAFSPVAISDGSQNWHGLGPISVLQAYQRQGIGKALVQEGLSRLKALGGNGCAFVGDPGFYQRFSFRNIPGFIHEGIPQEVFLALPFTEKIPHGAIVFHQGFSATS